MLDTFTKEEVNPFDKSTQFKSYSYTANYNYNNFGNHADFLTSKRDRFDFPKHYNTNSDDVEVF